MRAMYLNLTDNTLTYEDMQGLGDSVDGLKFTLVDRFTRKPVDLPVNITARDTRHEGVAVSTVTLHSDGKSTLQALYNWWNKCEIYEVEVEWYHIASAKVEIRVKGNEHHIVRYALKIEKA
uniref:Uncharacterized protein n=1 Tax=Pseudomonas phage RVTF4 TaxID=3236931 RepID=A0AB39CDI1_9VIRU